MSVYLGRVPHNHKDLTGKKYNNLTVLGLAYRKKRPVICKETGKVFKSVSECARFFNVYRSSIYTSIFYGFRCKGFRFDFLKGGI